MADTRCQLECEDWVRLAWLPVKFGQQFHRERLKLTSGGVFDFDAVSADRTMAITISTSGGFTASGKLATGKLMKLRSDMYFLLLASVERRCVVLTEPDMYELCMKEVNSGRVPEGIEFCHVELPSELGDRLKTARQLSSLEVSPVKPLGA